MNFRVFIETIKSLSDTIFFTSPDNDVVLKSVVTRRSSVTLEPIYLKTVANLSSHSA